MTLLLYKYIFFLENVEITNFPFNTHFYNIRKKSLKTGEPEKMSKTGVISPVPERCGNPMFTIFL